MGRFRLSIEIGCSARHFFSSESYRCACKCNARIVTQKQRREDSCASYMALISAHCSLVKIMSYSARTSFAFLAFSSASEGERGGKEMFVVEFLFYQSDSSLFVLSQGLPLGSNRFKASSMVTPSEWAICKAANSKITPKNVALQLFCYDSIMANKNDSSMVCITLVTSLGLIRAT